jgi:asparagine synthase (glutamine-hydrolysing)
VDAASMKESLEVRVPMLDEDLVEFGLRLPHRLKVKGRTCKRILRAVAARRLAPAIARKPKAGFAVPVDRWVNDEFRTHLREALLRPSSPLADVFRPAEYVPWVQTFCDGAIPEGLSRSALYRRVTMLLALDVALSSRAPTTRTTALLRSSA